MYYVNIYGNQVRYWNYIWLGCVNNWIILMGKIIIPILTTLVPIYISNYLVKIKYHYLKFYMLSVL